MSLRIYDPVRKEKVSFPPAGERRVRVRFCGVSGGSGSQIGPMLAALTGDVIRRYLEYKGYEVTLISQDDVDPGEGSEEAVHFDLPGAAITLSGEKLSQCLGEDASMERLVAEQDPEHLNFYLLSRHFRRRVEFDGEELGRAAGDLETLREFSLAIHERLERVPVAIEVQSEVGQAVVAAAELCLERWKAAMDDDFNTGGAIDHILELVGDFDRLLAEDEAALAVDRQALENTIDNLRIMTGVLGVFRAGLPRVRKLLIPEEIAELLEARKRAREEKNWAEADRLRGLIQEAGFQILDGPEGSHLKRG